MVSGTTPYSRLNEHTHDKTRNTVYTAQVWWGGPDPGTTPWLRFWYTRIELI